jgi:hypothetical protein
VVALSVASTWVVIRGASDEPYVVFRHSDALVQVGIGTALIVLWVQFAIWLGYGVFKKGVHRAWLPVYLWILVVLFCLWDSPVGYVQDVTKFIIERR